jgi:eukaryotic-like serine/threonine-protein kinase
MSEFDFYTQNIEAKKIILEIALGNRGKCSLHSSGMCGEIFIFDYGDKSYPRYNCIKIPKPLKGISYEETSRRFIRELKLQLSFYHSAFVNWAFDFHSIHGVPAASFRYWESDLAKFMNANNPNLITKLSLLLYTCVGLKYCYRKGLNAHQDLKPENIFIRDVKNNFKGLTELDIYYFAMIADFGLSNASIVYNIYDGSRPYMAPEQWKKEDLSQATDVFALGVIFYELITSGYHPVGIKIRDFWPEPKYGNSKKWTRKDAWEKWVDSGCKINYISSEIDNEIKQFLGKMLSVKINVRPSIEEVINFLLELIKSESLESYTQLVFLIDYFENQTSDLELEEQWPYLFKKWNILESEFG